MMKPSHAPNGALSVAAFTAGTPTILAATDTATPELTCAVVLCVVGVAFDDVPFLRNSPSLSADDSPNKLLGIRAGRGGIEALIGDDDAIGQGASLISTVRIQRIIVRANV
jgi:hypothetical protein